MTTSPNSLLASQQPKNNYKFVNLWQSSEERRAKYWLARSLGANSSLAHRMRDWRLSKIERRFGLEETYNPHTKTYDRELTLNSQQPLPCGA